MSVAELERRYGPNAQVELRSAPLNYGAAGGYDAPSSGYDPDAYEEDPVELPVKRSPWLAAVVVLMLGIGAFLGFALHRQGLIPTSLVPGRVALSPTDSLPVSDELAPAPTLPLVSTGNFQATLSSALPAENADTPSEAAQPARGSEDINVNPLPKAAAKSGSSVAPGAVQQRRNADDAATLEAIRRERERLDRDLDRVNQPSPEPREPEQSSPPGYIEAETPSKNSPPSNPY